MAPDKVPVRFWYTIIATIYGYISWPLYSLAALREAAILRLYPSPLKAYHGINLNYVSKGSNTHSGVLGFSVGTNADYTF